MMQTAYSIETLVRAFPPVQPSPKGGNGRPATGEVVYDAFVPQPLQGLINRPLGEDRSADTFRFACAAAREDWSFERIKAMLLDPAKPISAHCLSQSDPDRAADRAIEKAFADLPKFEIAAIAASPYVWVPPEEIPPLDWILGHWLLRDEVTYVVAPGGSGKTTLLAATALSLITGKDILGKIVPGGPKRVWLWNLEDSVAMMTRTIQATALLHRIKPEDMGDRLFLDTARDGAPLCTAKKTRDGLALNEPVHRALVAELRRKKIDVLIVDPFVSSHEGNENDNGEMDRVVKDWCKVAQEAGCAIVLCHHTSKAGAAEVNTMSARGAVAMTAAARVVLVLNPMSGAEAQRLGVDPDERGRLVQVTMDKSNRAPVEKADWFRKSSVNLGRRGVDSAGAVEPWAPPQAVDLLTPDKITAIKKAFGNEQLRASLQSPDWAGYIVADALSMESPDRGSPARGTVALIMTELLKQKHLIKVDGKDNKGKLVPCLQVAPSISPPAQRGGKVGGEVESFNE